MGYASSIACQFTSEIAAHWLSQHFRGELALLSRSEMEREIARVLSWTAEVFPGCKQGYFVGPYVAHYIDDLVRDMGLRTIRKRNPLAEYLAPFWPERRQSGETTALARSREIALTVIKYNEYGHHECTNTVNGFRGPRA